MPIDALLRELDLGSSDLQRIVDAFLVEMENGLSGAQPSSLQMLPSFVGPPTGKESGVFYALDLGGTNFRVISLVLSNGHINNARQQKFQISEKAMTGTEKDLFDFIAQCVAKSVDPADIDPSSTNKPKLGFTFSFPTKQQSLDSGFLVRWTKGFKVSGVEGNDVVALLREAFVRHGVALDVVALANDTVGTLMTRRIADPTCDIGLITGTGCNACYMEHVGDRPGASLSGHMVINMEWGAFDTVNRSILPYSAIDRELDSKSIRPGEQALEKMTSGMYLGELARLAMLGAYKAQELFVGQALSLQLQSNNGFKSESMSRFASDETPDLSGPAVVVCSDLGYPNANLADRQLMKRIFESIARRAALVVAAGLVAILTRIDKVGKESSVAFDGSVVSKYPRFQQYMKEGIETLLGVRAAELVSLVHTQDGSGAGAAIIAAVAASRQSKM